MQESKSFYDLAISSTTPATLQDCGQPTLTNHGWPSLTYILCALKQTIIYVWKLRTGYMK